MLKNLQNSRTLHIKTIEITALLFAASVVLYVVSSLKIIYSSESKLIFDASRLILILLTITIHAKALAERAQLVLILTPLLIYATATLNPFIGQIYLAALITIAFTQSGTTLHLRRAIYASLLTIVSIMIAAKLDFIDATVGLNSFGREYRFVFEEKFDWGFWHPNVITSILASCAVASFYIEDKKALMLTASIYAVVLTETISRTYLLVPLVLAIYLASERLRIQKSVPALSFHLLIGLSGIFVCILFLIPSTIRSLFHSGLYNTVNEILSLRLVIAERLISQLSTEEYLSGFHDLKVEIDSFFINLALSIGLIPCLFAVATLSFFLFLLYKHRYPKELIVVALFIFLSNFEKNSGVSSLLFIATLNALLQHKNINTIQPPRKAH